MGVMASQITIVCSSVYSGADQTKHQSSASLAFVRGIHLWPVNFPHKWPVTLKMFPFDDVIMKLAQQWQLCCACTKILAAWQWSYTSVISFQITGNAAVCFPVRRSSNGESVSLSSCYQRLDIRPCSAGLMLCWIYFNIHQHFFHYTALEGQVKDPSIPHSTYHGCWCQNSFVTYTGDFTDLISAL